MSQVNTASSGDLAPTIPVRFSQGNVVRLAIAQSAGWRKFDGPVSFGGMALYFVMLARGTAARTTSNFHLVPGVTALMACLFLGDRLSSLARLGPHYRVDGMLFGVGTGPRSRTAAIHLSVSPLR